MSVRSKTLLPDAPIEDSGSEMEEDDTTDEMVAQMRKDYTTGGIYIRPDSVPAI